MRCKRDSPSWLAYPPPRHAGMIFEAAQPSRCDLRWCIDIRAADWGPRLMYAAPIRRFLAATPLRKRTTSLLRVIAPVTWHKGADLQKVREMARAGTDHRATALCRGEIWYLFIIWRRFQRIQPNYSFLMHDSYVYLYLWLRGKPLFSPATMEFDEFNSHSFLVFAIGNHISAP